jgi:S1-C subfamily serine protease
VNEGIIKFIGEDKIETNMIEKDNAQGSPLFDIQGKLIGIAGSLTAGQGNQIEAIPVSEVKNLIGF